MALYGLNEGLLKKHQLGLSDDRMVDSILSRSSGDYAMKKAFATRGPLESLSDAMHRTAMQIGQPPMMLR